MAERLTIGDIARRAGVSKGAVSFALNGRPGVSEETRQRILAIADEMSWRPHSAARALGRAKAQLCGLVWARPARTLGVEPFFAQMISGLQAALSIGSVGLQLLIVEDVDAELEVYRRWSSEHRVDGVVLFDLRVGDRRIAEIERLQMPCVVLGGTPKHGRLSTVWVDDRAAMVSIVEYLAGLGHRRIAHIAGMSEFLHVQRRMRALRDSAPALGLESAFTRTTDFSDTEGAAATRELLSGPQRPSAIIYDSDVMAVAGLAVAMEMGVSVPHDVSLVAFDDSALTRMMHPAITALTRDTFALGELVGKALLEQSADPGQVRHVRAPMPRLVVRESTAPPPVA